MASILMKVYFGRSNDVYDGSAVADEGHGVKIHLGRKGSDRYAKQSKEGGGGRRGA